MPKNAVTKECRGVYQQLLFSQSRYL